MSKSIHTEPSIPVLRNHRHPPQQQWDNHHPLLLELLFSAVSPPLCPFFHDWRFESDWILVLLLQVLQVTRSVFSSADFPHSLHRIIKHLAISIPALTGLARDLRSFQAEGALRRRNEPFSCWASQGGLGYFPKSISYLTNT